MASRQRGDIYGVDAIYERLPGALVVNAGRGTVVDTDALCEGLESGRLEAALEATDPEPLPPDGTSKETRC